MSGGQHRKADPYLFGIRMHLRCRPRYSLHMLSIIIRKLVSWSVIFIILFSKESQLRIALTLGSNLVARLCAAVTIVSRLFWFPFNSQSFCKAGMIINPKSCVSVRRACLCNGSVHLLARSSSWPWISCRSRLFAGKWLGYRTTLSNKS